MPTSYLGLTYISKENTSDLPNLHIQLTTLTVESNWKLWLFSGLQLHLIVLLGFRWSWRCDLISYKRSNLK